MARASGKVRKLSRRRFLQVAGSGVLAAAAAGSGAWPVFGRAQPKTLRIMQWSHFVPAYDTWLDGVFAREWGARNDTQVVVDHIALTDIVQKAAAEAQARQGHDLFLFLSPPAAYEKSVVDMGDVYREVEKTQGKPIELAEKSTRNPRTGKYFAFSDSFTPDPGNYRQDLWSQVGFPKGPDTFQQLLEGGAAIKKKLGNPVGLGLSQELDTNMALRALLWSFGGSEQDAEGKVTLYSKETLDALRFVKDLYSRSETAEVFTWDPSSNNRGILAGRLSYVQNAISVTRAAEADSARNPEMARMSKLVQLTRPLGGPVRRIAAEHIMDCYVIWDFARNVEGAKRFLVDYVNGFEAAFKASEFYNFPCFPRTVPDLQALVARDPKGSPPDKYQVLGGAFEWSTNVGYPGYASAAIDEVFNTFVLPTMFAKVARGDLSPEQAARAADTEVRRIFAKWA